MTIEKTITDNSIVLKLEGWLDAISAEEFAAETKDLPETKAIILDFDKVEYISSAGLRQVVACAKTAKELNAEFSVISAGMEVMSIFSLTGLDKKMNISAK